MNERSIPNYVDDQMQIFFWEIDEFFPSLTIFIVMFMWDQLLFGIFMTLAFNKFFSRFKNANMSGVLFHMFWWVGLMGMNKKFDNGATREAVK